jgi:predicted RNA binding protein YcfA (HicA-like mRNA interferase family)
MSKTFSGKYIIKILEKHFGFVQVSQKGSHIKLEKISEGNSVITIVPNHKEIQGGTFQGILELAKIEKKDFLKVAKRR